MTVRIAPGSSRHPAAQAFARELRKAMTARKASSQRLAEASGCMKSSIGAWRAANNLPQPATAARLAEALDWPNLLAIATDARRKRCPRCGASYVDATGAGNRSFCSADCRLVDSQLRKPTPAIELHAAVRAATDARLAGEAERVTLRGTLDALFAFETATQRQRDRVGRVSASGRRRHTGPDTRRCRTRSAWSAAGGSARAGARIWRRQRHDRSHSARPEPGTPRVVALPGA